MAPIFSSFFPPVPLLPTADLLNPMISAILILDDWTSPAVELEAKLDRVEAAINAAETKYGDNTSSSTGFAKTVQSVVDANKNLRIKM